MLTAYVPPGMSTVPALPATSGSPLGDQTLVSESREGSPYCVGGKMKKCMQIVYLNVNGMMDKFKRKEVIESVNGMMDEFKRKEVIESKKGEIRCVGSDRNSL